MLEIPTLDEIKPADVFGDAGADAVLAKIEAAARAVEIDISTEIGRRECASAAYKVAKLKNGIDELGKGVAAEWKAKAAKIDSSRRTVWDRLEKLQADIRQPLTEFETTEQARIQDHETRIAAMSEAAIIPDAALATAAEIQGRLLAVAEAMQRDWQEFGKRATEIADAARDSLQKQLATRQKYDADQAELARLRDEQAKRDQADREARIKADAEATATKRAEAEITAAKGREEAAIKAAQDAKEKADRDAREAVAKAERDTREAADRAEREKNEAIEAERARVAKAKADEEAAAAKREADIKHRGKINREALAAISIAANISEEAAKPIVEAIARGAIPHVQIRY